MLIVDMSNLVFGIISDYHRTTGEQCDMSLFRHLVISKLKSVKTRLRDYSDEIVIACDSTRGYWRKGIFPHYKAHRKKDKEDDSMDWEKVFECFDQFKQEMREFFPVKVLEVKHAEADDIMAVLAYRYGSHTPVCIFSSDKDLLQIQQSLCGKAKQFSMSKNAFIDPKKSDYDLFEHICRGDDGDGIPNILSPADTFVTEGKRQKPMMAVKLKKWKQFGIFEPEKFCENSEMLNRFIENRNVIDLTLIPEGIKEEIVQAYDNAEIQTGKMFTYLTANRLNRILKEGGF